MQYGSQALLQVKSTERRVVAHKHLMSGKRIKCSLIGRMYFNYDDSLSVQISFSFVLFLLFVIKCNNCYGMFSLK